MQIFGSQPGFVLDSHQLSVEEMMDLVEMDVMMNDLI